MNVLSQLTQFLTINKIHSLPHSFYRKPDYYYETQRIVKNVKTAGKIQSSAARVEPQNNNQYNQLVHMGLHTVSVFHKEMNEASQWFQSLATIVS